MIPNPWIILVATALWAASVWHAYDSGGDNRENKMRANYATQLETNIADHNDNARIDREAVAEWAGKNAHAQGVSDGRKAALAELGRNSPPPAGCVTPEPVRLLLNSAIDDANNRTPAPDSVPGAVPAAAETAVGGRTGPAPMGVGSDKAGGRLPGSSR